MGGGFPLVGPCRHRLSTPCDSGSLCVARLSMLHCMPWETICLGKRPSCHSLSAGILLTSCVFIGRGRYIADPLRTVLFHGRIVCSVLVNLIVTLAIAARLREAEQELRRISSVSGTPYKAAFCIFLDSALPPTIVGVLICVAIIPLEHYFPDRPIYTHWITVSGTLLRP
ncbi:hypothetical protein BKA70DRAFT_265848 [Coprinopsis sp. MPI-PUGE-AT-0042]|nr:hypothetical protein BKA70DRAFT_265848 [Coprinopsis sp. MPI-PUGE-AT-0042]